MFVFICFNMCFCLVHFLQVFVRTKEKLFRSFSGSTTQTFVREQSKILPSFIFWLVSFANERNTKKNENPIHSTPSRTHSHILDRNKPPHACIVSLLTFTVFCIRKNLKPQTSNLKPQIFLAHD